MKIFATHRLFLFLPLLALIPSTSGFAQGDSLKDDLVSYWPLDVIEGTKTPDIASGFDLTLENLDSDDLITGVLGNAFRFTASRSTYLFRTHAPGDDLPANKHDSFTVVFWAKAEFNGQADKRLFSEGSNTNNNPLFTIGTATQTSGANVDIFIRQAGTTVVNHVKTVATPFDGVDWHHIAFVQSVQPDGSSTRSIYVDGVIDSEPIGSKEAGSTYNMNITSFGAVLRTGGAAWVNGDIDEPAIWKRALTEAEIIDVRDNGMPDLNPVLDPLVVNAFESDFRVAAMGDTARLRWDVTKDATIIITPDIGDVTATSSFGVGSEDVAVTAPATYTLTITRGMEDPVTATVSVSPKAGVAADWRWVEDFEGLEDGSIDGQARWLRGDGAFNVGTVGNTKAIRTTGGGDLTAVDLRSLTLVEGSSATLFFRFCHGALEPELPVDIKVGLTEKTIRFQGDYAANIGTYVILSRAANEALKLQAVDGIGGVPTDANFTFEVDRAYNVWIDITNNALGTSDTFSVHVAEDGSSQRTTVFDNITSDREPQEVPLLGFPQPDINHVFVVASTADQSVEAIAFDDFYISTAGSFNSSIPSPGSLGKITPLPFKIVDLDYNTDSGLVSIEWNSKPGETYSVWFTSNLQNWSEAIDSVPASPDSQTTSLPLPEPFSGPRVYFEVRK